MQESWNRIGLMLVLFAIFPAWVLGQDAETTEALNAFEKQLSGLLERSFSDLNGLSNDLSGKGNEPEQVKAALKNMEAAYPPGIAVFSIQQKGGQLIRTQARMSLSGFAHSRDKAFWASLEQSTNAVAQLETVDLKLDFALLQPIRNKNKLEGLVGLAFQPEQILGPAIRMCEKMKGRSVRIFDAKNQGVFDSGDFAVSVKPALLLNDDGADMKTVSEISPPRAGTFYTQWKTVRLGEEAFKVVVGRFEKLPITDNSLTGQWTGAITENRYGETPGKRAGKLDVLVVVSGDRIELIFAKDDGNARKYVGLLKGNAFSGWVKKSEKDEQPDFIEGLYLEGKNALKGSLHLSEDDALVKSSFYLLPLD